MEGAGWAPWVGPPGSAASDTHSVDKDISDLLQMVPALCSLADLQQKSLMETADLWDLEEYVPDQR